MGGERTYFARMVNGGPVAVDTVMLLGARVTAVEGYQSRPLVLVYAVPFFLTSAGSVSSVNDDSPHLSSASTLNSLYRSKAPNGPRIQLAVD